MLVCMLFAGNGIIACAAEKNLPDGFLIDDENGISVDGAGEYFMYVDDLDKGDVITRTLTVRNLEQAGKLSLYLTAEPLETTGPVNWLDNLHLKVFHNDRLVYEGRLRGDGKGTKTFAGGGKDMTESLLDLGSYHKGDYGVIKFVITVDADHVGYWTFGKKSTAEIKWIFSAVNDEVPQLPKTGEIIRYGLYILTAVFLILSTIIFIRNKKLREACLILHPNC